eukprot:2801024-Alexandrium_andersonii.AAC.1
MPAVDERAVGRRRLRGLRSEVSVVRSTVGRRRLRGPRSVPEGGTRRLRPRTASKQRRLRDGVCVDS